VWAGVFWGWEDRAGNLPKPKCQSALKVYAYRVGGTEDTCNEQTSGGCVRHCIRLPRGLSVGGKSEGGVLLTVGGVAERVLAGLESYIRQRRTILGINGVPVEKKRLRKVEKDHGGSA